VGSTRVSKTHDLASNPESCVCASSNVIAIRVFAIIFLLMSRCADYYVGIPGVNVMYKAGECGKDLPLTADLSVCSIVIGLTAWHGTNKILAPGPDDIIVVSGKTFSAELIVYMFTCSYACACVKFCTIPVDSVCTLICHSDRKVLTYTYMHIHDHTKKCVCIINQIGDKVL